MSKSDNNLISALDGNIFRCHILLLNTMKPLTMLFLKENNGKKSEALCE